MVRAKGRSLEITRERLLESGYGSDLIHLVFNIWYDFNYVPAYNGNKPQIDHIFPQSVLKKIKDKNPNTGHMNIQRYKSEEIDQLANCMLLTASENGAGAGGKSDTLPEIWFRDKSKEYLARHLIPNDPKLWKVDRFREFTQEREKLILEKFKGLLSVPRTK